MLMQDNDQGQNPMSPEPQIQPTLTNESVNSQALHHKLKHHLFSDKRVLAVVLLVVIAAAAAAFFLGRGTSHNNVSTSSKKPSTANSTSSPSTAQKLPQPEFTSGNSYFSTAKKLPDLGFITNLDKVFGCGTSCSDITNYYQIGTTAAGLPIIDMTFADGPGGVSNSFFVETSSGKYSLLAQNGGSDLLTGWQPYLVANVTVDYKTKLNDILLPTQVTIAGLKLKTFSLNSQLTINDLGLMADGMRSIRGGFYDDVATSAITKLGSQGGIDYYEVVALDSANYKVVEDHAAYKSLFSVDYQPDGEIARTQGNLAVKWTHGENNSSTYFSAGTGCGSYGYVVAKNINSNDLTQVGTTPEGQALYQLPSSNPLVKETYSKDYAGGQGDDPSLQNLTLTQFTNKHAYFLAKNGLGEYVLYMRDDMIIRGGCAKPVIYLYPTAPTSVSVKIGAQVINSAPAYGDGWYNVMAYPDGSLKYNGKIYDNLFWDGYGNGAYPDITSGTIVKTPNADKTVRIQLAQQGLNAQEISDFMNFWQPKLNSITQPYTRLSWLSTSQMNSLAPLNIKPAPQTIRRVFLDFEGLSRPYKLSPQTLSSFDRNGFTVVEWGGLLRSGLH